MSKLKAVLFMSATVLVLVAVAVPGASAHEWLTLAGAKVTSGTGATTVGTLELKNTKIPALEGGGEIDLLCMGQLLITVGPGAGDVTILIEDLSAAEQDKLKCETSKSTNGTCKAGTLVIVTPLGLPWSTELVLEGTTILDKTTATTVGYEVNCNGIANKCTSTEELSRLKGNAAAGAEFEFFSAKKATCTFGEGFVNGSGTTLNFLAN
jgi:hypothetical protein